MRQISPLGHIPDFSRCKPSLLLWSLKIWLIAPGASSRAGVTEICDWGRSQGQSGSRDSDKKLRRKKAGALICAGSRRRSSTFMKLVYKALETCASISLRSQCATRQHARSAGAVTERASVGRHTFCVMNSYKGWSEQSSSVLCHSEQAAKAIEQKNAVGPRKRNLFGYQRLSRA
jgi:hypothetical protein